MATSNMVNVHDVYNSWEVLEILPNGYCRARCECGKIKKVLTYNLVHGRSKNCGCKRQRKQKDITGMTFGYLKVDEMLGGGYCLVTCVCGKQYKVYAHSLLTGASQSCGCMRNKLKRQTMLERFGDVCANKKDSPRQLWQMKAVESREDLLEYIQSLDGPVTVARLMSNLDLSIANVLKKIHSFGLEDYISFGYGSVPEEELISVIKEVYEGEISRCNRKVLENFEIDIYLPELNLGVEYNGNYWHCDANIDKWYHQRKVLEAEKNGIRLISIFEYEWDGPKRPLIKQFLKDSIKTINAGAREFEVTEISLQEALDFEKDNHLQGSVNSGVNVALKVNINGAYYIAAVATFGTPRFDRECQYELLRLCFKNGLGISGGTAKMFKYFVEIYKPTSIVSYCDISKFRGDTYENLGFTLERITEPNYVWFGYQNRDVLPRYKTMKSKLIEKGLGAFGETEQEIMENLGYLRIYDCGNKKYVWRSNNK